MKLNHCAHRRNIFSKYYNDIYRVVKHFNIRTKRTAIFYELTAETANLVSTALSTRDHKIPSVRMVATSAAKYHFSYVEGSNLGQRRYFFLVCINSRYCFIINPKAFICILHNIGDYFDKPCTARCCGSVGYHYNRIQERF